MLFKRRPAEDDSGLAVRSASPERGSQDSEVQELLADTAFHGIRYVVHAQRRCTSSSSPARRDVLTRPWLKSRTYLFSADRQQAVPHRTESRSCVCKRVLPRAMTACDVRPETQDASTPTYVRHRAEDFDRATLFDYAAVDGSLVDVSQASVTVEHRINNLYID